MAMQTAREFFIHELQDMLDAERNLTEALGEQAEESSRADLGKAFSAHQQQTTKQVERLEQVLALIGEAAEEKECHGIRGLIQEHESFKEEDPAEDLLDMFNVGAATKVERYEISAYESLLRLAGELDLGTKVERLLQQNLREEQQTLKKMEAFSKKLKPENLGMEEGMEEQAQEAPRRGASRRGRGRRAA